MSTTDANFKKRMKEKKSPTGPVYETSSPTLKGPKRKLVLNETIHVHEDADVGGNLVSKLIFVFSFFLLVAALFFSLNIQNENEGSQLSNWWSHIQGFKFFGDENPTNEDTASVRDISSSIETQNTANNVFEYIISYLPFYGGGIVDEGHKETTDEDPEESEDDDRKINEYSNNGYKKSETNDEEESEREDESENEDLSQYETRRRKYNSKYNINFAKKGHNRFDSRNNDGDDDDNEVGDDDDDETNTENEQRFFEKDDEEQDDGDRNNNDEDDVLSPRSFFRDQDEETDDRDENEEHDDSEEAEDSDNNSGNYDSSYVDRESLIENLYGNDDDDDENNDKVKSANEKEINDYEKYAKDGFIGEGDKGLKHSNDEHNEDEAKTESSNVLSKLGVGVALIFVAYTVIFKKWTNYGSADGNDLTVTASIQDQIASDVSTSPASVYQSNQYSNVNKTDEQYSDERRWSTYVADGLTDEVLYSDSNLSDSEFSEDEFQYNMHEQNEQYRYSNITNEYDQQLRDSLDDADDVFDEGNINLALEKYKKILRDHKSSARSKYGIARVLDSHAEIYKSNEKLLEALRYYEDTLRTPDLPDALLEVAANRAINRSRFIGEYDRSIVIQKILTDRFPDEVSYQNELVVTFLMLNRFVAQSFAEKTSVVSNRFSRISDAKKQLQSILRKWPTNGVAIVYYGFVLKLQGNLLEAVTYLRKGLQSGEDGTQDGRFYFHLGDALQKLSRNEEAMEVYETAAKKGLFLSKFQRSLYTVPKLRASPWWTLEQTTYVDFFKSLEANWKTIRDEALQLLSKGEKVFREESEQLRDVGDWRQFELYNRGRKTPQCDLVPFTCRLVGKSKAAADCRRGQIKFSVMQPGTHVWPHCGPTNCRLRAHLGLVIPKGVHLRVDQETRTWEEGKVIVFDDSFEHEVWHNGTSLRLILIVDVWHPELTEYERKTLSPI